MKVNSFFVPSIVLLALLSLCSVPVLSYAQTSDAELQSTIRNAILTDPRTQGMSQEKIDAVVNTLTSEAQVQGVTVRDLTWRPRTAASFLPQFIAEPYQETLQRDPDWCGVVPAQLCMFGVSFGLIGTAYGIPIALGSIAMVLIVLISYTLVHHKKAEETSLIQS